MDRKKNTISMHKWVVFHQKLPASHGDWTIFQRCPGRFKMIWWATDRRIWFNYNNYIQYANCHIMIIVWSTSLKHSSVTWIHIIHIRNDGWLDDWRSVATPACTFETSMELSLAVQQCFDHRYMAKACRTSALLAWFRLGVVWLVHAQNLLLYIVILHYL